MLLPGCCKAMRIRLYWCLIFNFSNGGSFTITANIVFSADVNILNNTISANYSQAVIPQSVNENFNQSTSLPAGWTLNSGWSISPVYGIFSNGLYRNFNSNSSSTFFTSCVW